jgi:integrase/recombinase XerD
MLRVAHPDSLSSPPPSPKKKLPTILTITEIRQILNHLETKRQYTCLSTIYSCGLRISESVSLKMSDIDSRWMIIHIHGGKGAKDRYAPLPKVTLAILLGFWKSHRNTILLFPGKDTLKLISIVSIQVVL